MRVRSLVDLATAACIKNIRGLEGVGDYLPYENVRHILLRVENAHQLRRIELNSPQIEGKTGEIWLKLIEKDFPIEYRARGYKPQDPKKWFKVWEKYKREHDDSVKESAMKLKDAFAGLRQDREKNTSKIVERRLLPRSGATGPPEDMDLEKELPTLSCLAVVAARRPSVAPGLCAKLDERSRRSQISTAACPSLSGDLSGTLV
uniref:Elongin-A n=1 Tax=Bionectria ochroleuca TaxID=29856 RepID=A0A8H7N8X2_BIOOC